MPSTSPVSWYEALAVGGRAGVGSAAGLGASTVLHLRQQLKRRGSRLPLPSPRPPASERHTNRSGGADRDALAGEGSPAEAAAIGGGRRIAGAGYEYLRGGA